MHMDPKSITHLWIKSSRKPFLVFFVIFDISWSLWPTLGHKIASHALPVAPTRVEWAQSTPGWHAITTRVYGGLKRGQNPQFAIGAAPLNTACPPAIWAWSGKSLSPCCAGDGVGEYLKKVIEANHMFFQGRISLFECHMSVWWCLGENEHKLGFQKPC